MRREKQEAGEMDGPFRQHLQKKRKSPGRARRLHPALCLVFGESKLVDAVRVERRTRALAVDAARVDLGEMREKIGREHVVAPHEGLHTGV
jgi:hypothetical protein